ncbi:NAD(+) synthase [Candidatus Falkowbacteria bacterium]|nr:NAD(+) synthase [Candidatus Falkowbacteria bacterium]
MIYKLDEKKIKEVVESGSTALFRYCFEHKKHFLVTGISGGLDSAVTLGFAQKSCELAKNKKYQLTSLGLIMPCLSDPNAEKLARQAIKNFSADELYVPLDSVFETINNTVISTINIKIESILDKVKTENPLNNFEWSKKVAQGNIKARLRMMCGTYHIARMLDGIVLSTDNLSEFWMGFWTLNGDVGDFGVIQSILKGVELYDIAQYLGVPSDILKAKPDDGLGIAGGDEDQLGANYETVDKVMIELIQKGFNPNGHTEQLNNLPSVTGVPKELVLKLAKRSLNSSYKRRGCVVVKRDELGLAPIKEIKL